MSETKLSAKEFLKFYDDVTIDLEAFFKALEAEVFSVLDEAKGKDPDEIIQEIIKKVG